MRSFDKYEKLITTTVNILSFHKIQILICSSATAFCRLRSAFMTTVNTRPTPRLMVKKVFAQRSPSWSTISDEA